MKKLRIQVDGKVYDVTVEVLEDDEAPNGGGAPKPSAQRAVPRQEGGSQRPRAVPNGAVKDGANGHQDTRVIRAPIAGTVQKVFVQAGGQIEAKAPVLLLDAMKMDTYIYAPRAGKIAKVGVNPGDAVRVGQTLFEYEQED